MNNEYDFDNNSSKYRRDNIFWKRNFQDDKKAEDNEKLRQNNELFKKKLQDLEFELKKKVEENQSLNIKIKQLENDKMKMQKLLEEDEKLLGDIKKEKI